MESNLEAYIRNALIRRPEAADGRPNVRREEADDGGKRRGRDDGDKRDAPVWEDKTTVSVAALGVFLEGLLAANAPPASSDAQPSPASPQQSAPPVTGRAADAARAYQNTAGTQARVTPPASAPPPSGGTPLSAPELRTIYQLVADLGRLSARGVTMLEILRSESFLQSLIDAVERALTAP